MTSNIQNTGIKESSATKQTAFSSVLLFLTVMELQFLSFHVLFAFLLFMFMVLKKVKRSNAKNFAPKLPPGPWKLPLIGNMHHLVGSLPHHTLRDLAMKYGSLMHLQLGELSTIIVSSPEIAKQVMKTHDIIFAGRPYLLAANIMSYDGADIAFSPYGDYWRQLRKICITELLNSKCVKSFRSIREEEVSNFIRTISLQASSPINLTKRIFSLTYCITSRAAFGKKCKDQDAFISVNTDIMTYFGGFYIADMYPSVKWLPLLSGIKGKLEKMHKEADRILENIVNEHKERKTTTKTGDEEAEEDLVDILLKLQEHGDLEFPLSHNSIKAVILNIFSAGTETSSTTAKTRVLVNAWAIGRDPECWTDAERFYPERFLDSSIDYKGTDFEFIPFGAGRRICPGISFALPSIELQLAQLLYHFDWELPGGIKHEDLDMTESFGVTVRRKRDLHLVPIPYHPLLVVADRREDERRGAGPPASERP